MKGRTIKQFKACGEITLVENNCSGVRKKKGLKMNLDCMFHLICTALLVIALLVS